MADTLSKFGVPLAGERLGILHPKQSYRFRVLFSNFGNLGGTMKDLTQNVVKVSRPQLSDVSKVDLHSYNSRAQIAGKHLWGDITLSLRDDITSASAKHVGAQMQKQFNFFEQTSAVAGVNYKFKMEIQELDGTDGDPLEIWVCEGCFLTQVNYNEHDYGSSDEMLIDLTIAIDNATHIRGPAGSADPMVETGGVTGLPGTTAL